MEELAKEFGRLEIKKESETEATRPSPKVGVLSDKRMLEHFTTKGHPEAPERITAIMNNLREKGITKDASVQTVEAIGNIAGYSDPIDMSLVLDVHGQNYTDFISGMWPEEEKKRQQIYVNVDTYFNKNTLNAAQIAANAGVKCVDRVQSGEWKSAFAVIRPPGHHSGMKSQPNGFCIINNVAVAAQYAIKKYGLQRVLIVDWDAHHGQGTQQLFYNSKEVMYASLHRFDEETFFPHVKESGPEFVGRDAGKGYNINVAWNLLTKEEHKAKKQPKRSCGDEEYIYAFERLLLPIFRQYQPQMIFVSAGFDSACGDPLGGLGLSQLGYAYMTQQLMRITPKLVALLEGGYDLEIISWGAFAVVRTLLGQVSADDQEKISKLMQDYIPNSISTKAVGLTVKQLSALWPALESQELVQLEAEKTKLSELKYPQKQQHSEIAQSMTTGTRNKAKKKKEDELTTPTKSEVSVSEVTHQSTTSSKEISKLNAQLQDLKLEDKLSTRSEPVEANVFFKELPTGEIVLPDQVNMTKGKPPQSVSGIQTTDKAVLGEYKGPITRSKAKQLQQQRNS